MIMRAAVLVALGLFVTAVVVTTAGARFPSAATPASPGATATTPVAGASSSPGTPTAASSGSPAPAPSPPTTSTAAPSASATAGGGYSAAEVAQHATSSDCWIVVNGRVYDVTRYLSQHPAGARTITPWCGKESTVAYETEDGVGTHSSRADRLLESYAIGELRR